MKDIFYFFSILLFSHINFSAKAQEIKKASSFEGRIIYKYTNLDTTHPISLIQQDIEYIKGNKLIIDAVLAHGQADVTYIDGDNFTATRLQTIDDVKYAIKFVKEELQTEYIQQIETVFTNETKTICGYSCLKALIKLPHNEGTIEAWYAKEIANRSINFWTGFANLDGAVLEQVRNYPTGIKYKIVATQVIKEKYPDDKFVIPADYKKTTKGEMYKLALPYSTQGK